MKKCDFLVLMEFYPQIRQCSVCYVLHALPFILPGNAANSHPYTHLYLD